MKRILTYLTIILCSISFANAQSNSEKAKEILDKVSSKTKSFANIKISFTFAHETKENNAQGEKADGTLDLKGEKYKLSLMGNVMYCDGKTLWTHMIEEKETTIQSIEGNDNAFFNPAKILTIYENGYKYKFMQERFEKGRAVYLIDLFPKDVDGSEFSRVRLTIDKDKSRLQMAEYFSKDNNKYIITLNTFVTTQTFADSYFTFDKAKHPGVEIIDER